MSDQQKQEMLESEETSTIEEQVPAAAVEPTPVLLPGAQLMAKRLEKRLTIDDVASFLKLAPRQVHAIEADDYAALPGLVITRGFIRTYAKLVHLAPEPLLAGLPKDTAPLPDSSPSQRVRGTTYYETSLLLRDRNKLVPIAIGAAIVVVVLAVAVTVLNKTDLVSESSSLSWLKFGGTPVSGEVLEETVEIQPAVVEVASPVVASAATTAMSNFEPLQSAPVKEVPVVAAVAAKEVPAPAPVMVPVVAALAVVPVKEPVVVKDASTVTNVVGVAEMDAAKGVLKVTHSKDLLRLVMREDAWVEIRRADDTILFSRLLSAGTTESFDIAQPVQLVVGNASGVDATLRGAALPLTVSKNNVARLNLK